MVTAILGYAQLAPLPKTSTRSPPRSAPLASTQPASSLTTLRFGQDCRSRPGGDARLRPRWRRRGRDRDRPPRPVRCRSDPDYRRSRRATDSLACLTSERRCASSPSYRARGERCLVLNRPRARARLIAVATRRRPIFVTYAPAVRNCPATRLAHGRSWSAKRDVEHPSWPWPISRSIARRLFHRPTCRTRPRFCRRFRERRAGSPVLRRGDRLARALDDRWRLPYRYSRVPAGFAESVCAVRRA